MMANGTFAIINLARGARLELARHGTPAHVPALMHTLDAGPGENERS